MKTSSSRFSQGAKLAVLALITVRGPVCAQDSAVIAPGAQLEKLAGDFKFTNIH